MVLFFTSKSGQNYAFIIFSKSNILEYSGFKRFYNLNFQLETPTAAKGSVAEVGTQGKLTMLNVSISMDFNRFH